MHVVVGRSAAKSLGEAIQAAGSGDCFLTFPDDLSYGPIDPPDADLRAEWILQNLTFDLRDEVAGIETAFWAPLSAWPGPLVLWVSRRSTREYTGFLETVHRLGDRPTDVVDITDAEVTFNPIQRPERVTKAEVVGHLLRTAFFREDVIGRRTPLADANRKEAHELWSRLRSENAPLRVLRNGELVSAPLSHFDGAIKAQAGATWRKTRPILGTVMGEAAHQVTDFVLIGRLLWLIEAGELEARNQDPEAKDDDLPWFEWEVRVPQR
jgi:hypothetical protein